MAASRSSRVTRSSVGLNGLDENFCGRTLRNRSIAQPEETPASPLPRARSPKKKQESKQESKHDAKQESKHDANEAEQWTGSRKRGVSCIERDVSPEKSENCDKGKRAQDAFPQIKRAKRCSRSGESQGQEEDPESLKPESPVSLPEPSKENSCEELPSQNSANTDPASPVLGKQAGELPGRTAEDGRLECDGPAKPPNDHKASNGLRENKADESDTLAEEPRANPASATNCPSLLNGSQTGAPSFPDPAVPCRNSDPGQMEVSGSEVLPASSVPTCEGAPVDPVPELMVAKEQEAEEMEVDVVGDPLCLAHEEQVTESPKDANGRTPTPVSPINNNSNSGETTPPLTKSPSPTEPGCNPSIPNMSPSFTELYEHRYTLRTSPRRAVSGGKASSSSSSSSSKPCSPPRDNGPLKEEGEAVGVLQEDCPAGEDPAPSDFVGPSSEEPVSVNPGERAAGEDGGSVEGREAEGNQKLTQSRAAEEEEEEEEEEPDVYYFESDHLALKHNKEYVGAPGGIFLCHNAMADWLDTLRVYTPVGWCLTAVSCACQVNLGLPCPQRVVQLPDVAWEQYTSGLGDFEREFCDKKRKTRRLKLIFDKGLPVRPKSPLEPKKEAEASTVYSSLPTSDAPENGRQTQMIRGRICHPNKPDTFNQLWTVEEQRKLEQLLVKFPPEEVESRRWQKIADELGNRTAKQVASRVQKYFIKLTKAGIPVPGRTPNLCMYTKKASSKRQHHLNKHLYRPSTFLTSYEPPVYMDEDDERAAYFNSAQDPSADESDEESIPPELRNLPEYKELLELKRLKKHKLQEIQEDKAAVRHVGFKVRTALLCAPPSRYAVSLGALPHDSCVCVCCSRTETHKPSHQLEPVQQAEPFLDRDYCLPQSAGYNYLDPNYFPANR
uniref:ZZ-type zinc finger-containing protein 3 n=1 Tax=Salarias fasciatus TaxID=181472 RepID=A0A672I5Z4_SALFA